MGAKGLTALAFRYHDEEPVKEISYTWVKKDISDDFLISSRYFDLVVSLRQRL